MWYYKRNVNGGLDGQMKMDHLTAHGKKIAKELAIEITAMPDWQEPAAMLSHNTGHGAFNAHKQLGLTSDEKWFKAYETLGNITSATLPVNYDLLRKSKPFVSGDRVGGMFNGSGLVFGYFNYTV